MRTVQTSARPEKGQLEPGAPSCEVKGADLERVRQGRAGLLPERDYNLLAATFRSLADPTRARILHSLSQQDLCTCDLAAIVCLSEPAVSQHLRLLRELQLVRTRREGKKVFYALADAHVRFLLRVSLAHLAHGSSAEPEADPIDLPA